MIADPSPQTVEFFTTVFEPGDTIPIRPIEVYVDDKGQKRGDVDYKGIDYLYHGTKVGAPGRWVPCNASFKIRMAQVIHRTKTTKANVFFGVCPRVGSDNYDLAWQIRLVRCLWADVDQASTDDVLARCAAGGIPRPSILVNSGNGAHLYWRLDKAFVIDDAPKPKPVFNEFIEQPNGGKKKVRKYYRHDNGANVYLDNPRNIPELSAKAQLIQDILGGLAAPIGGDHTHDLTRILRAPGTLNRKDQRNGKEPIPCELVHCERDTRYPIESFLHFADNAPSKQTREKIARVPLPTVKPKLSAGRADHLGKLITVCDAAGIGQRSDADFSLCCWAIEEGVSEVEVWSRAESIGKFAERGHAYFVRTWERAARKTREKLHANAEKQATKVAAAAVVEAKVNNPEGTIADYDPETVGLIKAIADTITDGKLQHFARDPSGRLYFYRRGAYRPKGERVIHRFVKSILHEWEETKQWTPALADGVVTYIAVDAVELWERPPMDVICLTNGLLSIKDRKLNEHSPDYLSTVQLPVAYDPAATCPDIEKFVGQVFPADAAELAYELAAWLIIPNVAIQRAVLLLGEGANGKSRFLQLLLNFLGASNCSAVSLHSLEADRFAVAGLLGKLANVCADLPSEHLEGTSVFKKIVGGDSLSAERKYGDAFELTPFCRLIFSANHPPRSQDASYAFFRRWVAVPFDRTFSPEEQVPAPVLDARLSTPAELSGLLNKALDVLPGLIARSAFNEPESVREALSDFRATTDPLSVWLERALIDGPDMYVSKGQLRSAYNEVAEHAGRPTLGNRQFGAAIARLRPNLEDGQRMIANKRTWCYIGIGLKDTTGSDPFYPDSQSYARDARDARNPASPRTREEKSVWDQENYSHAPAGMANSVHRVHGVYPDDAPRGVDEASCDHEYGDWDSKDGPLRACINCGRFYGSHRREVVS